MSLHHLTVVGGPHHIVPLQHKVDPDYDVACDEYCLGIQAFSVQSILLAISILLLEKVWLDLKI